MNQSRRTFLKMALLASVSSAVMPSWVEAQTADEVKRILVYGDSNSFGWAFSKERGVYRLNVSDVWPRVMERALGSRYQVEINALGGRTVDRDEPNGSGSGKIPGDAFNGLKSLPEVLSQNMPLDLVIIMLGTNDSKRTHATDAKQLAEALGQLAQLVQSGNWQAKTHYKVPKVLLVAPPLQPDETAYSDYFKGARSITTELPKYLSEKAASLGAYYVNSQDFVKDIPQQMDRVHLSVEQHKQLGLGVADKVKEIF